VIFPFSRERGAERVRDESINRNTTFYLSHYLKSIYKVIFQEKRNLTHALEIIKANFVPTAERDEVLNFIENSHRGIIKGYAIVDFE